MNNDTTVSEKRRRRRGIRPSDGTDSPEEFLHLCRRHETHALNLELCQGLFACVCGHGLRRVRDDVGLVAVLHALQRGELDAIVQRQAGNIQLLDLVLLQPILQGVLALYFQLAGVRISRRLPVHLDVVFEGPIAVGHGRDAFLRDARGGRHENAGIQLLAGGPLDAMRGPQFLVERDRDVACGLAFGGGTAIQFQVLFATNLVLLVVRELDLLKGRRTSGAVDGERNMVLRMVIHGEDNRAPLEGG
mmetsp:Transcript_84137/g.214187  ORF Transcript_84137/g.214187 Transcript_84137/m.214187 type:complete len:247 (+) Transcript_84137:198-938(+)